MSIYMPMVLELPIAMLACSRIGAIHSIVVFNYISEFNAFIEIDNYNTQTHVQCAQTRLWRGVQMIIQLINAN